LLWFCAIWSCLNCNTARYIEKNSRKKMSYAKNFDFKTRAFVIATKKCRVSSELLLTIYNAQSRFKSYARTSKSFVSLKGCQSYRLFVSMPLSELISLIGMYRMPDFGKAWHKINNTVSGS
jgi:hypothetical protein